MSPACYAVIFTWTEAIGDVPVNGYSWDEIRRNVCSWSGHFATSLCDYPRLYGWGETRAK